MKKKILFIICVIFVGAGSIQAASRSFGMGIILGEPTGISMKIKMSRVSAIDGALAWSLDRDYNFHLHVDYLMHRYDLISVEKGQLPLYYGIGGRIKIRDDDAPGDDDENLGARFPVGLNYLFYNAPFDMFFEIVPILDLIPDTDFDINAAIGFRYWF